MAEELKEFGVTAVRTDHSPQAFMNQDFLRSSQFMFIMPNLPFDLGALTGKNPRGFSMLCESVEFPGKNVIATDYKIPGTNRIRVPYSKEYPEVTMTFIHNVEIPVYDIFSYWIDYISDDAFTSINNKYFDEITTNFNLIQYTDFPADEYGKFKGLNNIFNSINKVNEYLFDSKKLFKVTDIGQQFINNINNVAGLNVSKQPYYTVAFTSAYPLSFAPMASSWADEGFQRLTVTFTYESYSINDVSKSSSPEKSSAFERLKMTTAKPLNALNALDSIISSKSNPGGGYSA
jgi:hypothetical protein